MIEIVLMYSRVLLSRYYVLASVSSTPAAIIDSRRNWKKINNCPTLNNIKTVNSLNHLKGRTILGKPSGKNSRELLGEAFKFSLSYW